MSDNKVVALPGFSVPDGKPVAEVVGVLEEALERAKTGKVTGVAAGGRRHDPTMAYRSRHE